MLSVYYLYAICTLYPVRSSIFSASSTNVDITHMSISLLGNVIFKSKTLTKYSNVAKYYHEFFFFRSLQEKSHIA